MFADAGDAGDDGRGGDNLEGVAGEERKDGEGGDFCRGEMGESGEPCGSGGEDEEVADGCRCDRRAEVREEARLARAAVEPAGGEGGEGIGDEVSAIGAEELGDAAGSGGAEDGES